MLLCGILNEHIKYGILMIFTENIYYMKEHHKLMDRTVDRGLFSISCISAVTFILLLTNILLNILFINNVF